MMKINKKSKEGIKKKIALISLAALILNTAMIGVFAPLGNVLRADNEQMCEAAVDIVLVMDRSGSMYSSISQAKTAANSFLGNLGVNDQSALVSYASTATLDKGLSNNHTGNSPSTESYVNALCATGMTNIGGAIDKGTDELLNSGRSQAVKTMILLTDGKANRPTGNTYNYPYDYAIDKAIEAAGYGYIIFTIGLGNNIDAVMLQKIADETGGNYYFAPDGDDLEAIYNEISTRVCLLGSISGCKYIDSNKDGIITGEQPEAGWEIILSGHANQNQETDEFGCYEFAGLLPGTYTVSEGGKSGEIFEQTYPLSGSYSFYLDEGDNVVDKDFGNYTPFCGNSFVDTGYTGYTDEVCEIGNSQECNLGDNYLDIQYCNDSCSGWGNCIPQEWCGDGSINIGEECDGPVDIPHYFCTDQCMLEYVPYCGDGTVDFDLGEQCDGGPQECIINEYIGSQSCNDCLLGECIPQEFCGDGETNGPEQCDDGTLLNGTYGHCNADCTGNTPSVCGNGDIEGDETCDDGNTDDGDGCSSICQIEIVYQCSDDLDNDGDNLIDEFDPGCHSDGDINNPDSYNPEDDDEYDSPVNEGYIIINELMWSGSSKSTSDEWVELKNTTQSPIDDLNGCKLYKKGGGEIADLSGLTIGVGEYLVVSRKTQEDSNISIIPDLLSSSISLSNTDLEITLYCGQTLIDIAGDGYAPLAGYNGSSVIPKKSMSRKAIVADGTSADSWCTAATQKNWDAEAEELGTPGEPNVCNLISGYKFNDANNDGIWDNDEIGIEGWMIELYNSLAELVDGIINPASTNDDGYYEFKNLDAGIYTVKEVDQPNWSQTFPLDLYYEVEISEESPISENNNFGNFEEPVSVYQCSDGVDNDDDGLTDSEDPGCHSDGDVNNNDSYEPTDDDEYNEPAPYCGDGTCDANIGENCSTCPQDCGSCGGGGGGGVIVKPTIIITNEKVVYLGGGEALVTWTTNIETTRQVAYGDDSVTVLGAVPEYGYDSVNGESLDMTKEHSVTIGGLTDGVIYYFRPVADRSGSTGEKVGEEVTYVFEEDEGDVKGIESPPEQPVECNYLLEYIKLGADNNPVEVEKLELFLNEFEGENLAVNGIYEQVDFDAVSRFQEKYNENVLVPWSHEGSTGYVYITTKKMINELYCQREFPLTPEQESEVSAFSARFLSAPIESGEAFDGDEAADFEVPTAEDIEEGRVGGAETEEGEEFTEIEGEESERSQKIEIGLEDEGEDEIAPSSNYYRYILIILALIILVLAYRFYNSRKKQKEDIQ